MGKMTAFPYMRTSRKRGGSARSQNIDVRHHLIRMLSVDEVIRMIYVASREQYANLLTKSFGEERFKFNRDALMST